jgi:hypothetical protein
MAGQTVDCKRKPMIPAIKVGQKMAMFTLSGGQMLLGTLPASSVSQTISGLPNGMYKLLAAGHAVMQGSADPTAGAFLFAGSGKTPLNVGGGYAVADVLVVGGSLTIGFKLEGTITANWAGIDNFRLQYFGVDLSSLNDLLTEKVDEAQVILDATGNSAGYNNAELETAIANVKGTKIV